MPIPTEREKVMTVVPKKVLPMNDKNQRATTWDRLPPSMSQWLKKQLKKMDIVQVEVDGLSKTITVSSNSTRDIEDDNKYAYESDQTFVKVMSIMNEEDNQSVWKEEESEPHILKWTRIQRAN